MDPAYPEHEALRSLLLELSPENQVAINPTIIHEAYHTLVYGQKWVAEEAARRLNMLLKHPYIKFYSQTRKTCILALNLAWRYGLGGRDALIIANYLSNNVPILYTRDRELAAHGEIRWKNSVIKIVDPL